MPNLHRNNPSLLRHDDVVTLFHEMGHAIHHLFSECKEYGVSGVNGIAWDTVEFPSQFLENFAYEKGVLQKFALHHESGEPMSGELLDKIKGSKNFQSALGILRQIEFALFDMRLHLKLHRGGGGSSPFGRDTAGDSPPQSSKLQQVSTRLWTHLFRWL